jgi:uncharacterized secreted protein with C-terminal beta-propeller domain
MSLNKFERKLKKEYNETFKGKKQKFIFTFKLRHALALLILLLGIILLTDHISVNAYNKKLAKEKENIYNTTETSFIKLENKNDYKKIVGIKKEKHTILSKLSFAFAPKYSKGDIEEEAELAGSNSNAMPKDEMTDSAPESSFENSTNTNVQVVGIDEADYSKCDGTYIYSAFERNFMIFDLEGNKIIQENIGTSINGLYVYENKIIVIGWNSTIFYEFNGTKLTEIKKFEYMIYNDSRLKDNYFYLIFNNNFNKNEEYEDMYYDQVSGAYRVYSIIKFDLTTNEYKEVNNLNSGNVTLYMSNNHIYLATLIYANTETYYHMTVTSIFDHDLNPIAALRVKGSVLNQFSMDEYDKYFRIVTTNNKAEKEKLNAISIFDLKSKTLVGYLDEGIGLDRQVVKSVRYDATTCYVVTYLNTDPLYEIDLTDPTKPTIVSIYQSPGYSNYLHSFKVNGETYLFGIGYCDDQWSRKISIYKNNEQTTQIGKDLIITDYYSTSEDVTIQVNRINNSAFTDHRALFIYLKDDILYLGLKVTPKEYYFFKIDINNEENVISVYETIDLKYLDYYSRCYLVNNKIYITDGNELLIKDVK